MCTSDELVYPGISNEIQIGFPSLPISGLCARNSQGAVQIKELTSHFRYVPGRDGYSSLPCWHAFKIEKALPWDVPG